MVLSGNSDDISTNVTFGINKNISSKCKFSYNISGSIYKRIWLSGSIIVSSVK